MTRAHLVKEIKKKQSFLCIGLDTDLKKIPKHLLKYSDPVFEFNKRIIEATHDLCVAYKPNLAFYEAHGSKGWRSLEKTLQLIPRNIFTIADAKRGDIGNTSALYAQAFFKTLNFDAVTVAPYMGSDSVLPFLTYRNKWVILLALTSNTGAGDFQTRRLMPSNFPDDRVSEPSLPYREKQSSYLLFEEVIERSLRWGNRDNMMYVVGATRADALIEIRKIIPRHFLLVPGVGAQGGSLQEVCKYGLTNECGLLVNSSRNILYAGSGKDFARKAREEAKKNQTEMAAILKQFLFEANQ